MKTEEQIKARIEALRELVLGSNELDEFEYYRSKLSLLEWVLED